MVMVDHFICFHRRVKICECLVLSFVNVKDFVQAIISLSKIPAAVGEVFSIGSNNEIAINSLAKSIIDLTESSSVINFVSYEETYEKGFEDMQRRVPDISKT